MTKKFEICGKHSKGHKCAQLKCIDHIMHICLCGDRWWSLDFSKAYPIPDEED